MSKRNGKKGRGKGKNGEKREKVERNYENYEKRREEAESISVRIQNLKKLIPTVWKDASARDVAILACLLDMVFRNNSYRVHYTYMQLHPGSVNMYGLKKIPSKSTLHNMAKGMSGQMSAILALLMAQAGSDAHGTLAGDSTGFCIMRYKEWEDAKRGVISRREFDKLHILVAPHGKIATCEVTRGRAHDSPVFRRMMVRIPFGAGDILLDAAYLAKKNCTLIEARGRRPVICPKSNTVAGGFNAMGRMLRWYEKDKKGFKDAYHQRSLVENAFSVMKSRFGASARARTAPMRRPQLVPECICYNLIA